MLQDIHNQDMWRSRCSTTNDVHVSKLAQFMHRTSKNYSKVNEHQRVLAHLSVKRIMSIDGSHLLNKIPMLCMYMMTGGTEVAKFQLPTLEVCMTCALL